MIKAAFHMRNDRVVSFDISGHSGFATEGSDIICAAVSAAAGLVETTVNDVLGLAADTTISPDIPRFSLRLPGGLCDADDSTCQNLMVGLMLYLSALQDSYPEFVHVSEV